MIELHHLDSTTHTQSHTPSTEVLLVPVSFVLPLYGCIYATKILSHRNSYSLLHSSGVGIDVQRMDEIDSLPDLECIDNLPTAHKM